MMAMHQRAPRPPFGISRTALTMAISSTSRHCPIHSTMRFSRCIKYESGAYSIFAVMPSSVRMDGGING
jgi:hypothetical protein